MEVDEMGEHATINKYASRHAVTRYHVPDHEIAKVHWAPD